MFRKLKPPDGKRESSMFSQVTFGRFNGRWWTALPHGIFWTSCLTFRLAAHSDYAARCFGANGWRPAIDRPGFSYGCGDITFCFHGASPRKQSAPTAPVQQRGGADGSRDRYQDGSTRTAREDDFALNTRLAGAQPAICRAISDIPICSGTTNTLRK